MDEFITPVELLLLVALFGGPIFALAAGLAYAELRRGGLTGRGQKTRVVIALCAAIAVALPLTGTIWWVLGELPSRWAQWLPAAEGPLALVGYVGIPALLASALCFPLAVWFVRRRARRPDDGTETTLAMSPLVERMIHSSDYSPELGWRLCDWCRTRGAQTFALEIMGTAPEGDAVYVERERPIRRFRLPARERERLTAMPDEELTRMTELWSLSADSLRALPELFPDGMFEWASDATAWCEDLTLYRDEMLMLGIVSHEGIGILRVTEQEAAQLSAAGFPTHDPVELVP